MKKTITAFTIIGMKWLLISDSDKNFDELGSVLRERDKDFEFLNPGQSIENLQ